MIRSILNTIARRLPVRRISDPRSGAPYLDRYYVAGNPGALRFFPGDVKVRLGWLPFTVYLHHIIRSDWGAALHDHPWGAVSVLMAGGYIEERLHGDPEGDFGIRSRWRGAGSVAKIGAHVYHRIEILDRTAWTLFFVGRKRKSWSFFDSNLPKIYPYREYIESHS